MNPLIIEKKYVNLLSPQLERFEWKKDDLANCRCPVCGDSGSNARKARGYFYLSKHRRYRYKCHNCGVNLAMTNLLEKVSPTLHKEFKLEYMREMGVSKPETKTRKDTHTPFVPPRGRVTNGQTNIPQELETLTPITSLPVFHRAYSYLKQDRKIPSNKLGLIYYTDNVQSVAAMMLHDYGYINVGDVLEKYPQDARILMPSINRDGRLTAIQSRAIGNVSPAMRYLTMTIDPDEPRIFGLDRIDFNKRVYCVEGQLDSLYLPNAIAVSGSGLSVVENAFSPSEHGIDIVYIHDNQPRNREIVKEVGRTITSGAKVVIWEPNSHLEYGKDIGDMIESGLSPEQVQWEIDRRTFSGVKATLEFGQWAKVGTQKTSK